LKTLAKWKWDGVLHALRGFRMGLYIRIKEEINKEQIIADVGAQVLTNPELRKAGVEVSQEESFYIEPKLTAVETRQVAKAEAA
jgi:phage host-nuclease inhibitor protein Gam